jgi:hypothetical protein
MNCWTVLGLPASTDARSIKRQYATLLKQTRPDEDPVGFQRLREAYEQALEWSRRHEDSAAPWDATPVAISEASQVLDVPALTEIPLQIELFNALESARNLAQARATELLQRAKASELDLLFEKAVASDCQLAFEEQLLPLSLAPSPDARTFAAWGLKQFQWLTPWQRTDLPAGALQLLLQQSMHAAEARLLSALADENAERFLATLDTLIQSTWLQALERREWLNQSVARLLFEAEFWSDELFSKSCHACGWSGGVQGPEPYWSRLLSRHQEEVFLTEQRHLAQMAFGEPASRAARLIFGRLGPAQRIQLTRRFEPQDWEACRLLADTLRYRYPGLCPQTPEGNPYFWQVLRRPSQKLPMLFALVLGSATGVIDQYFLKGSSALETSGMLVFWMLALIALAACIDMVWRPLANRLCLLDNQLSERYARYLSLKRPTPLLLLESMPALLLGAGVFATYDLTATGVFLAAFILYAAIGRSEKLSGWLIRVNAKRTSLHSKIAMSVIILVVVALQMYGGRVILGHNQGLQPWPERSCGHLTAASPRCLIPATSEQWYGAQGDSSHVR